MGLIDGLEILSDLNQQEKDNLTLFCQEKKLAKGEILFYEGEEATAMYFLKSGNIEIIKNINGEDSVLGVVNAEEILGEMALFGSVNKRMATTKALSDSELIVILTFSIKEITKKHPALLEKIKMIINKREEANKKFQKLRK